MAELYEPKGAKIHLKHRAALRVHRFGADVDIKAGLVAVTDCFVEMA